MRTSRVKYDRGASKTINKVLESVSRDTKFKTDVLFGMASSYDELDDFERAKSYYKQIESIYPSPKVIEIRIKGMEKRKSKKSYKDTKL
jgi:hypothetical protein